VQLKIERKLEPPRRSLTLSLLLKMVIMKVMMIVLTLCSVSFVAFAEDTCNNLSEAFVKNYGVYAKTFEGQ